MHHLNRIFYAFLFLFVVGCSKADAPAADATPAADAPPAAAPAAAEAVSDKQQAHATHDDHEHKDGPCVCNRGKAGGTVWCDACGAGYIKGEKVTDKAKVDAALAALADADPCERGKAGETVWCDGCNEGFINGEKVTDKALVMAALEAETKAHEGHGHADGPCVCDKGKAGETVWCDACGAGYIDGKKVTDKAAVEAALAARAG